MLRNRARSIIFQTRCIIYNPQAKSILIQAVMRTNGVKTDRSQTNRVQMQTASAQKGRTSQQRRTRSDARGTARQGIAHALPHQDPEQCARSLCVWHSTCGAE